MSSALLLLCGVVTATDHSAGKIMRQASSGESDAEFAGKVRIHGDEGERFAVHEKTCATGTCGYEPQSGPYDHLLHDPFGDESAVERLAADFCARGYALLSPGLLNQTVVQAMAAALATAERDGRWGGMPIWKGPHKDVRLETYNLPFMYPFGADILTALADSIVPLALRRVWLGAKITVGPSSAQLNPPGSESMEMHFDGNDPLSVMLRIYPEGQVVGQGDTALLSGCKRHMASRGGDESAKQVQQLIQNGELHRCWAAPSPHADVCATVEIANDDDESDWTCDPALLDEVSVISPMPVGSVLIYSHRAFHTGLASLPGGKGRRIWEINVGADPSRMLPLESEGARQRRAVFEEALARRDALAV